MVAMNAETYARDVREVASGGYLDVRLHLAASGAPAARATSRCSACRSRKLCNENFNGVRTRILMKNICYAGVLAALLDLDLERIRELLARPTRKKPQLVDSNMKAIAARLRLRARELRLPAAAARREDGQDRAATS